jgi:hypothetical protein
MNLPRAICSTPTVQLEATVRTGATAAVPFDLVIQGRPESANLRSGDKLLRVIQLLPGSNEIRIRCHGPQIVSAGDPRRLVFALENWRITPIAE